MKKITLFIVIVVFSLFIMIGCNGTTIEIKTDEKKEIVNYGIIEIPKIKLNRQFIYNANIDKDISMLPISNYPSNPKSLLVLAAHSGNSIVSYFNYLYKLKIDDKIYILYDGKKYVYKILEIQNQKKDGKIDIYKMNDTRTLILVTCTNNKKGWQTIYTAIETDNN